jgi:hypothetical protein
MGTELFRPDGQTQETQPSSQGDKTQEEYTESHRMKHRKRKRQRDLSAQARVLWTWSYLRRTGKRETTRMMTYRTDPRRKGKG